MSPPPIKPLPSTLPRVSPQLMTQTPSVAPGPPSAQQRSLSPVSNSGASMVPATATPPGMPSAPDPSPRPPRKRPTPSPLATNAPTTSAPSSNASIQPSNSTIQSSNASGGNASGGNNASNAIGTNFSVQHASAVAHAVGGFHHTPGVYGLPPPRRGSMPAGSIAAAVAQTAGRRGSIAKFSPNVPVVPLSTASMNAVYNAAAAQRSLNPSPSDLDKPSKSVASSFMIKSTTDTNGGYDTQSVAGGGAGSGSDGPNGFNGQVSKVFLTFKNPLMEQEYQRETVSKMLRGWQIYVTIAAVASVALTALRDMQSTSASVQPVPVRLGIPLFILACHLAAIGGSFFLVDNRRAVYMQYVSLGVLGLHVLVGVILHDMLLVSGVPAPFSASGSMSMYKSGFLFSVSMAATIMLLRLRFTLAAASSLLLWITFMVAGAQVYPWPTYSVIDYVFVGALTCILNSTVSAFVYETERRSREDFYRAQFYVRSNVKYFQQLMA
ncbi:hypothetical protein BCR44DRAFT_145221, partial [Catenaria anguillulae PL171]